MRPNVAVHIASRRYFKILFWKIFRQNGSLQPCFRGKVFIPLSVRGSQIHIIVGAATLFSKVWILFGDPLPSPRGLILSHFKPYHFRIHVVTILTKFQPQTNQQIITTTHYFNFDYFFTSWTFDLKTLQNII